MLLANVEGTFYALSDVCGHLRAPLSRGRLDGYSVECPLHFARFDVRTGALIDGPVATDVPTYQVRVEDGNGLRQPGPPAWLTIAQAPYTLRNTLSLGVRPKRREPAWKHNRVLRYTLRKSTWKFCVERHGSTWILRGEMKEGFAKVEGEIHLVKWMLGAMMSLMLPLIAGLALLIRKQFFGSP